MRNLIIVFICIILFSSSCDSDENNRPSDDFNREVLLEEWADHLIIPAFETYVKSIHDLKVKKDDFVATPTMENLLSLRDLYLQAYHNWQGVSIYDIGHAEKIGLRNFTNIYPTDTTEILSNLYSKNYNLDLPSQYDAQGFPAIDYLLYHSDDQTVLNNLGSLEYSHYLNDLVNRLHTISSDVLNDWKNGYRDEFINRNGSSASASVDKLVNDFIFYYEKFLRAGKVGIPAGVYSGTPLSNLVEAPYSQIYSKDLLETALRNFKNFYEGKNEQNDKISQSLADYLIYLHDEEIISTDIHHSVINQFNIIEQTIAQLDNSLKSQVETDNSTMLKTFDELQKLVVLFKVDMVQAMNIQIDYVDADGD